MGDKKWIEAKSGGEDAEERLKQDSKAPPFAPYYWGVREFQNGDLGDRATVEKVQRLVKKSVPFFMNKKNADSLFKNAEFWLGATGTGARCASMIVNHHMNF